MTKTFCIEIRTGTARGETFPLGVEALTIGRQDDCDIMLANDPLVSRRHARITVEEDTYFVENLGSLNGVFVNQEAIAQRIALKPGDEIVIGNHLLVFSPNQPNGMIDPVLDLPQEVSGNTQVSARTSSPATPPAVVPRTAKPEISFQDATRRLHLLYQIIRATSATLHIPDLLGILFKLIFQDLRFDRGCLYLLNPKTQGMEPFHFYIRGQEQGAHFQPPPHFLNTTLQHSTTDVFQGSDLEGTDLSLVAMVPLIHETQKLGFFYLDSKYKGLSVRKSDLEFLEVIAAHAIAALRKGKLEAQVQQDQALLARLERHVGSEVTRMVREEPIDLDYSSLKTEEREVTILFSDISGFTSMSEKLSPGDIAFLLNGYFNHMADCVSKHHGYLNKYIGDAVMAVFGAPFSVGNDAANAVMCALEMLERLQSFWKTIDEKKRFRIRIGINTGIVTAGNIGSLNRMEFTVIGDAVNLASRLESKAEPMGILIGESTYGKVKDRFEVVQMETLQVKGKAQPVQAYRVVGEKK